MRHADSSPRNALDIYRRDLAGTGQLDPEQERDLARRFRAGDRRAGDRLVRSNLPFVLTIAHEYRRWGVPMEDIVQQGNLGLLKAVERFDPGRNCRLVTYASYWVRAEIREYVVRGYRIVRMGTTKGERRALRAYRRTGEADPARLAALSGLTPEAAERLMPLIAMRDASLDEVSASGVVPLDRIPAPQKTPEEAACESSTRRSTRDALDRFLADLGPRDREIFRSRLVCDAPLTLAQLGARFGVSKERVRQLEARILERLKGRLEPFPELAEAG